MIARNNVRIVFQRNTITEDQYKNRIQSWEDYFSCWAYANTFVDRESGEEVIYENGSITFETRYCPELKAVTSTEYRIIFNGEKYNIQSVDPMNYQNKTFKFICQREVRS